MTRQEAAVALSTLAAVMHQGITAQREMQETPGIVTLVLWQIADLCQDRREDVPALLHQLADLQCVDPPLPDAAFPQNAAVVPKDVLCTALVPLCAAVSLPLDVAPHLPDTEDVLAHHPTLLVLHIPLALAPDRDRDQDPILHLHLHVPDLDRAIEGPDRTTRDRSLMIGTR